MNTKPSGSPPAATPSPLFYGWRVVAACFVIAAFAWALGLFGTSVYLQAVTTHHHWPIAQVSSAITVFFLVSALLQRTVGRTIDRRGARPTLLFGALMMSCGVALIGQVTLAWQLYPCFVILGLGWAALSTTGISSTVAPWFERYQGRSMTLAMLGASVGAIAGVPLLLLALKQWGLQAGLAAAGTLTALVLLPLIWLVLRYRNPAQIGTQRDGSSAGQEHFALPTAVPLAQQTDAGWLLRSATAGFALGLLVQIGFVTHHVALAAPVLGIGGAGMLVSATGLMAFIGRLVLARIVDRVNVRRLAWIIMLIQCAALWAICLSPSAPILIAGSLVYGYGIGHVTTLGPIVVRREFGAQAFGATYGSAAVVIQLIAALGPALFGLMRDTFSGYGPGLALAGLINLAAAGALIVGPGLARSKAAAKA